MLVRSLCGGSGFVTAIINTKVQELLLLLYDTTVLSVLLVLYSYNLPVGIALELPIWKNKLALSFTALIVMMFIFDSCTCESCRSLGGIIRARESDGERRGGERDK